MTLTFFLLVLTWNHPAMNVFLEYAWAYRELTIRQTREGVHMVKDTREGVDHSAGKVFSKEDKLNNPKEKGQKWCSLCTILSYGEQEYGLVQP